MNRPPYTPRPGWWSLAGGALLAATVAGSAAAQAPADASPPLARYVPATRLVAFIEHDGLDARPGAWEGTATARMLAETTLGPMLETIAVQLLDWSFVDAPGPIPVGKDILDVIKHMARRGFVAGCCGTATPPELTAAVLAIRGAEANPAFARLIAMFPDLHEPAARKVELPGGRTVRILNGIPVRWWYEKGDAVFSYAPADGPDPVADALDGKAPGAIGHPARIALAKPEPGDVPVGRMFVDLTPLQPFPANVQQLGLGAIKRVEARWSIRGKAVSTMLAIQAPRPRQGILALLDQPAIAPGTAMQLPDGLNAFTLLSFDPIKTGDAILATLGKDDPQATALVAQAVGRFREQSGLSLRDDFLGKIGPRAAFSSAGAGNALGVLGMWFAPPDYGAVIELKDPARFAANLDRLMDWANRELKALGAEVPAPPGQAAPRPGIDYAEFRRVKGAERGYTLAIPPALFPGPAGLRPTVIVDPDRGLLGLGASPASARRALTTLLLTGPAAATAAATERPGEFLRIQSDPGVALPQLLTSIPSLVQLVASQQAGPGGRPAGNQPFRLALDPDAIPDAAALRPYLFPTRFAMAATDTAIRLTIDQAFPLPLPALNTGIEAPVLVALLLPAVQASREAARRSQCVNNLKQIGLAMHNHEAATGKFPGAAIVDKEGKPLLSWRVALLPYLDQQTLYNKFKLDEPWDSPTNKELIKFMPAVFACPTRPTGIPPGQTAYRLFTGPGTLFDAALPPPGLADVTDGTSNTIMVVEADEAAGWTRPEGLAGGQPGGPAAGPLLGGGSKHPGGFMALFADGSVHFLKSSINAQVLAALITRSGGEVISADSY